jgi:N-ethylmaleimide reductase
MALAYLHVIRFPKGRVDNIALGRRYMGDRLIGNESYTFGEAQQAVAAGELTAVSFGRNFIANPDLVERWQGGIELATFDLATLYTPGAEGYSNYPSVPNT